MAADQSSSIHPYLLDFSELYQRAEAIAHAYQSDNLVFFVGSGASKAYCSEMPTWHDLLDGLRTRLRFRDARARQEIEALISDERYTLAAEAMREYVETREANTHREVDAAVAALLRQRLEQGAKAHNNSLHLAILDFGVPIFTTNFDTIVEQVIQEFGLEYPHYTYVDQADAGNLLDPTKKHKRYLFKLHGSIHKVQDLIFDEQDYARFYFSSEWPTSLQLLRHVLATKMVVFVGFSLSDPELMSILREATRHSSSYQHIAFLYEPEVTPVERKLLRAKYKVDPILYQNHTELPLAVLEMRTFAPREMLPLHLRSERQELESRLSAIQAEYDIPEGSSCILFGSYVKYGALAKPKNDVDVLVLTPESSSQSKPADAYQGRAIDVTTLARAEFEAYLRNGDSFASGVLVTGCALTDPEDYFGILARGFRGKYALQSVLGNIKKRYELRWIRLCSFESIAQDEKAYLQACDQWAITLLQWFMLQEDYPLQSLLSMSLLANARYTIEKFSALSDTVDKEFLLSLMHAAKGLPVPADDFSILGMVPRFANMLARRYGHDNGLGFLLPGTFLLQAPPSQVTKVYTSLSGELESLSEIAEDLASFYEELDQEEGLHASLLRLLDTCQERGYPSLISTLDILFFMRVQRHIEKLARRDRDEPVEQSVACVQKTWSEDIETMKARFCKDARPLLDAVDRSPLVSQDELDALLEELFSTDQVEPMNANAPPGYVEDDQIPF